MTDADDPSAEPASAPTTVDHLAELQRIDTDADQLTNRRERLPERDVLAAATDELTAWERQRNGSQNRLDELTGVIERAESESGELAAHKSRLEAQMKTVIAPREAEALMHEIATIDEQVDVLDTTELEALEEQSAVDDTLTALLAGEAPIRTATESAEAAHEGALADVEAELASLSTQRDAARVLLSDSVLAKYDRVRASSGVAVARLSGHLCEGCHLDLSAAEVDDVKDEAAVGDGIAECPNCGRMLLL